MNGNLFLLAGGAALVLLGLRRGSLSGAVLAAAGGALLYRHSLRGTPPWTPSGRAKELLDAVGPGVNAGTFDHAAQTAKEERHPAGTLIADADELVDEMVDDSFPASDPPSYTAR